MVLLRDLVLSCLRHNTFFGVCHIPGSINSRAYYISRSQVAKFKALSPEADQLSTPVPENEPNRLRRRYQRAWVGFRQFYAQFFRRSAYSTIKLYLSAIPYVHKLKGFIDPTKSFVVEMLSTALRP